METFEELLATALNNVVHNGSIMSTKTIQERQRDFDFPNDIIFVIDGLNYNITTQKVY